MQNYFVLKNEQKLFIKKTIVILIFKIKSSIIIWKGQKMIAKFWNKIVIFESEIIVTLLSKFYIIIISITKFFRPFNICFYSLIKDN